MLEDLGMLAQQAEHWNMTQGVFLWWLADELKRNVRDETDFKTWIQAQEMDGLLTSQQKEHLTRATSSILVHLGKGAGTLIESFAQGAASAALKQMGMV